MINRKNLIPLVVSLIVIGALIFRDYPQVGLWVTIVALSLYIIADLPRTVAALRSYSQTSQRQKIKLGLVFAMALILISASVSGNIYYFLTLVVLAVDFIMFDKRALK